MRSSKIWKDKAEEMDGGSEGGKGIENAGWKKGLAANKQLKALWDSI